MPKYFFNIRYEHQGRDTVGEELPDEMAAWREATLIAGELFRDIHTKFEPGQEWSLEISDEDRKPLYVIKVSATKL
jgi:hypothetical protein